MLKETIRRAKRTSVAAIMLAALLALCSTPPALAQSPTKLKVAIVSRTIFFLPLWIAEERGFLKQQGLATETVIFNNSEKINEALHANEFQVAITSPESIVAESYKGGTIRLIAGNAERLPHFIITKPAIKTLAELKGATIGVLSMHDGTTFLLGDIAKAGGLTVKDFRIEAVGGAPTRWKLLKEGAIDAGLQPFPLSYEAEAAGFNNLGAVAGLIPEYEFTAIVVDRNWANAHRPLVVGFLRALRAGTDYMLQHPDEAAAIGAKELQTTVPLARRALDDTEKLRILSRDLSLSPASLRRVFVALQDAGVVGRDVAYDQSKFVDESFLKESR